jgi:hypothetical protein
MRHLQRSSIARAALLAFSFALALLGSPAALAGKTRNVVLIVTDGLRPEEVFTGAEDALLDEKLEYSWLKESELRRRYWDADLAKRRELLLPFMWGTVARQGQVFGNAALGSRARVSNGYGFSYPGYSEMSTGVADRAIDTNEYPPNPHVNVFEYLAGRPGFQGKVAVIGSWAKFHDIFNERRSHLPILSGDAMFDAADHSPRGELLRSLAIATVVEPGDPMDPFVNVRARDYLQKEHPRVLFVGFGDTDNWAHSGRYDLVLDSAHKVDGYIAGLWQLVQSMPEYRDQTTFIVTTDHGRGHGLIDWQEHGEEYTGSVNFWVAVMGPDTAPLGERRDAPDVVQAQIAATVAELVGEDFHDAVPAAAASFLPALAQH